MATQHPYDILESHQRGRAAHDNHEQYVTPDCAYTTPTHSMWSTLSSLSTCDEITDHSSLSDKPAAPHTSLRAHSRTNRCCTHHYGTRRETRVQQRPSAGDTSITTLQPEKCVPAAHLSQPDDVPALVRRRRQRWKRQPALSLSPLMRSARNDRGRSRALGFRQRRQRLRRWRGRGRLEPATAVRVSEGSRDRCGRQRSCRGVRRWPGARCHHNDRQRTAGNALGFPARSPRAGRAPHVRAARHRLVPHTHRRR